MKMVYCPIKDGLINGTDCIIMVDITYGLIKPSLVPEGIEWSEELREKCKACKYHNDIS